MSHTSIAARKKIKKIIDSKQLPAPIAYSIIHPKQAQKHVGRSMLHKVQHTVPTHCTARSKCTFSKRTGTRHSVAKCSGWRWRNTSINATRSSSVLSPPRTTSSKRRPVVNTCVGIFVRWTQSRRVVSTHPRFTHVSIFVRANFAMVDTTHAVFVSIFVGWTQVARVVPTFRRGQVICISARVSIRYNHFYRDAKQNSSAGERLLQSPFRYPNTRIICLT